jgi:hypothetical protein
MADATFSIEEYNRILESSFARVRELGELKGGEYAAEADRLDNFRRNAVDCGITMETCWRVYAGKHWDAISTYIRDLQTGKTRKRLEGMEGRVDDLLVYLVLFKCMLIERTHTSTGS